MTWVQAISGWALAYLIVSTVFGLFMWEANGEGWKGVFTGVCVVSVVLAAVTLGLLANGWMPI